MFAKLGALALFASVASALTIALDVSVAVIGTSVHVDTVVATGDVGQYNIVLVGAGVDVDVLSAVEIGLDTTALTVDIDNVPTGDGYVLHAVRTANPDVVSAESAPFSVKRSA